MRFRPTISRLLVCLPVLFASLLLAEPPPEVHVTVKTRVAQMRYDREKIVAQPGAKVIVTFQNEDDLPHNIIFCKPTADAKSDKGMEVATAAWALGEVGMAKQWIPDHARVLAASKMVDPHQKDTITFTAPDKAGEYPYVCTFPGHAMTMNGALVVSQPPDPIHNLHFRYYEGNFKKLPNFADLAPIKGGPIPNGKCDIRLNKRRDDFAYEFEGQLKVPLDGEYEFVIGGDDGVRLIIDGKVLVEHDGIHPFAERRKKVTMPKGEYNLRAQYFQSAGGAKFYLGWSGPNFTETALSVWSPEQEATEQNKEQFYGIPLVVKDEAVIYRNFIAGSGPRGIAVGYPGGINLCWDADQMNLVVLWQGAFMDAKRHWTGRGVGQQPPLGYAIGTLEQQYSLAVLRASGDAWPQPYQSKEYRDASRRFLGYSLNAKREPTFRWRYQNVDVTEAYEPVGDVAKDNAQLHRTLIFSATAPPAGLTFLAAKGKIEPQADGSYLLDKLIVIRFHGGVIPQFREGALYIAPLTFKNGVAEVSMSYHWKTIAK